MTVYVDVSCLSRLFDDRSQQRVRIEAEPIKLILRRCARGDCRHASSEMSVIEIEANPDADKRRKVLMLLPGVRDSILNTDRVLASAAEIERSVTRGLTAQHWRTSARRAQNADADGSPNGAPVQNSRLPPRVLEITER